MTSGWRIICSPCRITAAHSLDAVRRGDTQERWMVVADGVAAGSFMSLDIWPGATAPCLLARPFTLLIGRHFSFSCFAMSASMPRPVVAGALRRRTKRGICPARSCRPRPCSRRCSLLRPLGYRRFSGKYGSGWRGIGGHGLRSSGVPQLSGSGWTLVGAADDVIARLELPLMPPIVPGGPDIPPMVPVFGCAYASGASAISAVIRMMRRIFVSCCCGPTARE